jgi:probable rRNA maturation factor
MVNDITGSDTKTDPDSSGGNDVLYRDWQSPAGAVIEASIDTTIWPDALVNSFQRTAPKILDEILTVHDNSFATVSLCLCNDLQMQQINLQHRQIDRTTNVLSFPAYDMRSDKIDPAVPTLLGDIIIAAETVVREANAMQIPVADHLMHLFVHGMLHLFGHDHVEDHMAEAMEKLEIQFLAGLGIANPYQNAQVEGNR